MLILLRWLAAHLIGDFVLQRTKLVQQKKDRKAASWFLYLHCLIHAALVYLVSPDKSLWMVPLIVFVSHYCIDLWKVYQKESAFIFIIDQVFHITVLDMLWLIYYQPANWFNSHVFQL